MLGSYKVKLSAGPISLDKLLLVWQKYCDFFPIISLHERESEFRKVANFFLLDYPESWALESGIQLTIRLQNPSSTDKERDPVTGIQ